MPAIIIGFITLFFKEWILGIFNVKKHQQSMLNEYRLQRYDELVEYIEKMMLKDRNIDEAEKAFNVLWGKALLGAPDSVVRQIIIETKDKPFNKEERNRIYFAIRKELQPQTSIATEEIEHIYFNLKNS